MVVVYQLKVGGVNLVIGRFVVIVSLHHLEIIKLVVLIVHDRLEILGGVGPTQFPIQPIANAIQRIAGVQDIVIVIELIMVKVCLSPCIGLTVKLADQVR